MKNILTALVFSLTIFPSFSQTLGSSSNSSNSAKPSYAQKKTPPAATPAPTPAYAKPKPVPPPTTAPQPKPTPAYATITKQRQEELQRTRDQQLAARYAAEQERAQAIRREAAEAKAKREQLKAAGAGAVGGAVIGGAIGYELGRENNEPQHVPVPVPVYIPVPVDNAPPAQQVIQTPPTQQSFPQPNYSQSTKKDESGMSLTFIVFLMLIVAAIAAFLATLFQEKKRNKKYDASAHFNKIKEEASEVVDSARNKAARALATTESAAVAAHHDGTVRTQSVSEPIKKPSFNVSKLTPDDNDSKPDFLSKDFDFTSLKQDKHIDDRTLEFLKHIWAAMCCCSQGDEETAKQYLTADAMSRIDWDTLRDVKTNGIREEICDSYPVQHHADTGVYLVKVHVKDIANNKKDWWNYWFIPTETGVAIDFIELSTN